MFTIEGPTVKVFLFCCCKLKSLKSMKHGPTSVNTTIVPQETWVFLNYIVNFKMIASVQCKLGNVVICVCPILLLLSQGQRKLNMWLSTLNIIHQPVSFTLCLNFPSSQLYGFPPQNSYYLCPLCCSPCYSSHG